MIVFLLIIIAGLIPACLESGWRGAPQSNSAWVKIEKGLGGANVDGTFGVRYDLVKDSMLEALGFGIVLCPEVRTNAFAEPYSTWRVTGLRTSLLYEREYLAWRKPDGSVVRFRRDQAASSYGHCGAVREWIKIDAERQFTIADSVGRVWVYRNGCLVSLSHPWLGKVLLSGEGANIFNITREGDGRNLLAANYDDSGRLSEIGTYTGARVSLKWKGDALVSVHRQAQPPLMFAYSGRLLSAVCIGDDAAKAVVWKVNSAESGLPAPVQMIEYGDDRFCMWRSRKGLVVKRSSCRGQLISRTTINPRVRTIRQEDYLEGKAWICELND